MRALRALRPAPPREHLRAWVLTIATHVATDEHRRSGAARAPSSPTSSRGRRAPGYAELARPDRGLPPTERAAVVLRYGYDLDYQQIGAALGSSADAARQATSSGVRRLRRKELS